MVQMNWPIPNVGGPLTAYKIKDLREAFAGNAAGAQTSNRCLPSHWQQPHVHDQDSSIEPTGSVNSIVAFSPAFRRQMGPAIAFGRHSATCICALPPSNARIMSR